MLLRTGLEQCMQVGTKKFKVTLVISKGISQNGLNQGPDLILSDFSNECGETEQIYLYC